MKKTEIVNSYWDKQALAFKKKVEHYLKTTTIPKLKRMRKWSKRWLQRLWELEDELYKTQCRVEANWSWKWTDQKAFYKKLKKEQTITKNKFLQKHILPRLIEDWFFKTYQLPKKFCKTSWKEIIEWRQEKPE